MKLFWLREPHIGSGSGKSNRNGSRLAFLGSTFDYLQRRLTSASASSAFQRDSHRFLITPAGKA
jgi:hypothetical protein